MSEIDLDEVRTGKREVVILHGVQPHHALATVNRLMLVLVLVLMGVVCILGLLLMPRQNLLEQLSRQSLEVAYATQNPALSSEINALKGQMFGLVSGSIESKLRSLEEHIKSGSIGDSLDTLHDLKSDVKILSSYSSQPVAIVNDAANQQLVKELADIKSLIFLTFASCGLMLAAFAGIWLRHRYRLTHQKRHSAFLSQDGR